MLRIFHAQLSQLIDETGAPMDAEAALELDGAS
jgi:hypothetical protein